VLGYLQSDKQDKDLANDVVVDVYELKDKRRQGVCSAAGSRPSFPS